MPAKRHHETVHEKTVCQTSKRMKVYGSRMETGYKEMQRKEGNGVGRYRHEGGWQQSYAAVNGRSRKNHPNIYTGYTFATKR
jgi:hypothetical protein